MQQLPPRILVVDDNRAIHEDFRKILSPAQAGAAELAAAEALIFGTQSQPAAAMASFQIESAYQGVDAIHLVEKSLQAGEPYAMAFIDVRMPPGLDGIETTV